MCLSKEDLSNIIKINREDTAIPISGSKEIIITRIREDNAYALAHKKKPQVFPLEAFFFLVTLITTPQ
jgi:hypothetical protein